MSFMENAYIILGMVSQVALVFLCWKVRNHFRSKVGWAWIQTALLLMLACRSVEFSGYLQVGDAVYATISVSMAIGVCFHLYRLGFILGGHREP